MEDTCISVKALYDKYGNKLSYCTISTEDEDYYDLQTEYSGTVCMDGESCKIIERTSDIVKLMNSEGELSTEFQLEINEFIVATGYDLIADPLNIPLSEIKDWIKYAKSYAWISEQYGITKKQILECLERFALSNT